MNTHIRPHQFSIKKRDNLSHNNEMELIYTASVFTAAGWRPVEITAAAADTVFLTAQSCADRSV